MLEINREQLIAALKSIGIQEGDGLLVHSAVQYLGRPTDGINTYLEAILSVIGEDSTIAVPAFNFGFAKGERYDPRETPSVGMGSFSEYVRRQPKALRTPHPMQSLAVLGRYADDLVSRDTPSAFDPGSAFERLLELDFKILLLGADVNAISMLHYSEQRFKVPYRYWKDFTGEVKTPFGWETRTYRMYVRDLDIDPQLDLKAVQERLEEQGRWFTTSLNYGQIAQCRIKDFVRIVDEFLAKNPWSLVINIK